jgi:hypothetical protein
MIEGTRTMRTTAASTRMATTDPKAASMMTIAAPIPMPSLEPGDFTFRDGRIAEIEGISDPERLRHVDLAALGG